MRVIMVPVADRPECAIALASAFALAKNLGSNVLGCHVRPHRHSSVSLPAEIRHEVPDAAAVWSRPAKAGRVTRDSSAAHLLLDKAAQAYGLKVVKRLNGSTEAAVMWQEKVGSPDKIISIVGPTSDMLVVSRPQNPQSKLAHIFLLEALLRSGRPVLILPPEELATIGERVLIAWNQSNEAMRAVVAALPILQAAKTVTIAAAGIENALGPKSKQLAQYLRYWGVKAKITAMNGHSPHTKLLAAYHDTKSDLLVMGAYSRSRIRQRLFGGVTDFMLRRADIPVFMLHS